MKLAVDYFVCLKYKNKEEKQDCFIEIKTQKIKEKKHEGGRWL